MKKFTLLIVSLAVILGFSDSVWGQIGMFAPEYQPNVAPQPFRLEPIVQQSPVNLRNHPAMVSTVSELNLDEIGAGESVTLENSALLSVPYTGGGAIPGITLSNINIGSVQDTNVVIRTYSGNGYGIGWISVLRIPYLIANSASNHHECPPWVWAPITVYPNGKTLPVWNTAANAGAGGYVDIPINFALTPQPNVLVSGVEQNYAIALDGSQISGTPRSFVSRTTNTGANYAAWYHVNAGSNGYTDCIVGLSAKFQEPVMYSFNSFNFGEFWSETAPAGVTIPGMNRNQYVWYTGRTNTLSPTTGWTIAACRTATLFRARPITTPLGDGSMEIEVSHHDTKILSSAIASVINSPSQVYTTTVDATFQHQRVPDAIFNNPSTPGYIAKPAAITYLHDEVDLIQFNGVAMTNAEALANQDPIISDASKSSADNVPPTATLPGTYYLDNYQRPTVVALQEKNTFHDLVFNPLRWKFESNIVVTTDKIYGGDPGGGGVGTTSCNSGDFFAFKVNVGWDKQVEEGATFLDAAIQLINGARICITGSVTDNTGAIGNTANDDRLATIPYQETNALIVLPSEDRFTLRTKGVFQANMYHERTFSTASNVVYSSADFPDPEPDIYLYPTTSGSVFDEFLMGLRHLKEFSNPNPSNYTISPVSAYYYTRTPASVFGVYGDYRHTGLMADIHTSVNDPDFDDDNQGVIEVGMYTGGKSHFHIYSNGMLKNYEGCDQTVNFPMHFGELYGGTPEFKITTNSLDKPLYILNFGNNSVTNPCDAELRFHTTSVDSIGIAFTATAAAALAGNTAGSGPLHIQALSHVRFNSDGAWDASATGNNIYVLSDGGNISTQQLTISNDNKGAIGQGYITFSAETDEKTDDCAENEGDNRFANSGNIYLNDDVTINRSQSSDPTETTFIAENNIRTASFTANSGNNGDITNIISRKGDLYLGYSADIDVFNETSTRDTKAPNGRSGDQNKLIYNGTGDSGELNILAGWDDRNNNTEFGGGNIYFTHIDATMATGGNHTVNITIPFSNEYFCGSNWPGSGGNLSERLNLSYPNAMRYYEHAGIIGGVGQCGSDSWWYSYAGKLEDAGSPIALLSNPLTAIPSLSYVANNGKLNVDAGERGNIIMNTGTSLDFNGNDGSGFFRTRKGDIDMRGVTDITNLSWTNGAIFLADNGIANKQLIACDCDEQINNVYFQDLNYVPANAGDGSLFIGADNNIKLQYGGLRNIGTWKDPFLRPNQNQGYPCGTGAFHCDSDPSVNNARDLELDFTGNINGGGIGIVASDLIDIYKNMIYTGGPIGKGMSSVPGYGSLHGENVAGYGLYIKSQGNKKNWLNNPFEVIDECFKGCPTDACGKAFLHQVARVTFHADAIIRPENSKAYIGSPVLDLYGVTELNTHDGTGNNTLLRIQTDSLILHDDLTIKGSKLQLVTWSNLERNMPVIKFGHQRFTPPFAENSCADCTTHNKGSNGLDTINVTFQENASLARLHTLVADHTVLTFLTDSADHQKGNPIIDAKIFTDMFKVRNQVELWGNAGRTQTHSGHLELISEPQMDSKNYAGIYTRHLHLEPILPDCKHSGYSDLWIQEQYLDVITSSTFGGFGTLHADVHVEIEGKLAPGYASLGIRGNCYEQKAGTLTMQNLTLDRGAELHYSIGNEDGEGRYGELADLIEVDNLSVLGTVLIYVEKRCRETYTPGCYPIIRYNTVDDQNLNNLQLGTIRIDGYTLSLDFSVPGIISLCVGENRLPIVQRQVIIPQPPAGISVYPVPGIHYVPWGHSFNFTLTFENPNIRDEIYISTNRQADNGEPEILTSVLNANGEHEYTLAYVKTQPLYIYFSPKEVYNEFIDGKATVWSHGNTLYINVPQQDIASIYSITGLLVKRIDVPEGGTTLPMTQGAYIVTLKDGSVHKVIIR